MCCVVGFGVVSEFDLLSVWCVLVCTDESGYGDASKVSTIFGVVGTISLLAGILFGWSRFQFFQL